MKKIKKRVMFNNEFGETMTLVVCEDNNVYLKHDKITTEFEAYNDILINYKCGDDNELLNGYKYLFSPIENVIINEFVSDAVLYDGFLVKTDNIPVFEIKT
jgi:hypothetical protein